MQKVLTLIFAILISSGLPRAQKATALGDSELAAITARGRMLQDYDVASWHATDAVMALKPSEGVVRRYIAKKTEAGWTVVFGRFNEIKNGFLVAYEANQGINPREFTVKAYDPPREDTGFFYTAARGIQIALENTRLEKRPYNTYVLPLDSGEFYVYVLPAQTVMGIYPLGGDTRYLISADGSKIVETRQMHKTILENKAAVPGGPKVVSGFHTHVLTDTPEDTDVFHVLREDPPSPEFVGTRNGIYSVLVDGTIVRVK